MSTTAYHVKSKRLRSVRSECLAQDCTRLAAERNGPVGRMPRFCEQHAPRRHDILVRDKKKPSRATQDEAIEYITIDEWKKRYGLPGSGGSLDATRRAIGFSQRYELLEPDYCEDAEEAA